MDRLAASTPSQASQLPQGFVSGTLCVHGIDSCGSGGATIRFAREGVLTSGINVGWHPSCCSYFLPLGNGGVRGGIMRLVPVDSNAAANRNNVESS
ncbi:hypothetical protein PS874_05901 [Pseudomonas fluorescens]|nr:hypothetical protein PS874_05901 [Pseudomonas fluorescens]